MPLPAPSNRPIGLAFYPFRVSGIPTPQPTAETRARFAAPQADESDSGEASHLTEREKEEVCPKCRKAGCQDCFETGGSCLLCAIVGTLAGATVSGLIVNAIIKSKRR